MDGIVGGDLRPGPVLGLIPAKLGSLRLPQKNIRPLGGKPLIAWSIEAARNSGVIDRLIVSTEDDQVAEIAERYGAEIPFRRPAELARDPAGVVEVAMHALAELRITGEEYKIIIILLPTCPFRSKDDIREAFKFFQSKNARFLMSVNEYSHPPFSALKFDGEVLKPFFPEYIGKKSQELPSAWRANGAFHILDVSAFEKAKSYYAQPLHGYPMPRNRSIDIDCEEDWQEAEQFLAKSD